MVVGLSLTYLLRLLVVKIRLVIVKISIIIVGSATQRSRIELRFQLFRVERISIWLLQKVRIVLHTRQKLLMTPKFVASLVPQ